MKPILTAIALILLAALWRVFVVFEPSFYNVAPVAALMFCGGVYFRDWRFWLIPFAALTLSDLWLNHYHATRFGYTWSLGEMSLRAASLALALLIGWFVAQRRTTATVISGALGSSLAFYLASNTAAWYGDPFYARTIAGWLQAMTIGHPEFPPTLWFFRNTLLGDLLFTGLFIAALEFGSARDHRKAAQRA